MNRPSGFVPIRFRFAAGLLLALGIIGLLAWSLGALTAWFPATYLLAAMSAIFILIGIYLFAAISSDNTRDR